jgi:hypothetical protein
MKNNGKQKPFLHLIINSHPNPKSHNLAKPQPNYTKFIPQNYTLNNIEN